MNGGGGFGFGFQSPQDTDPYRAGIQNDPHDSDPTRAGIQAKGSVPGVPHLSSPYDTNPFLTGTQPPNQYYQQPPSGLATGIANNLNLGGNNYGGIRR